jgi:hypothetical protein
MEEFTRGVAEPAPVIASPVEVQSGASGARRCGYVVGALALAILAFCMYVVALFGVVFADTPISRALSTLYLYIGLAATMWMGIFVWVALKGRFVRVWRRSHRAGLLRAQAAFVVVALVYMALLFITNAGEWSIPAIG